MSLTIDESKAIKAFRALLKHEMLKDRPSENVLLLISTFNPIELTRENHKRISLKHPIQPVGTQRCLITKDREADHKQLFMANKIKGVHHILSVGKLKKIKSPHSLAELADQFGVFLVDQRALHLLPKALKKEITKRRIELMPINLSKKDLQKEVLCTVSSTDMNFYRGSSHAIKIASTAFNEHQAVKNLMGAIPDIIVGTKGGADNIRALHIKTAESTSFTIYDAEQEEAHDDSHEEEEEYSSQDDNE